MEVSTKQLQIAELAATRPEESFTSLNHYLDMDWMKEAYRRTRRESASGVDGQTMEEYGKELESNLQERIGLAKSGRYHAPPVRRVHIPKGDGKETRPIGIPTCQDKVLQRAITMLLEPIYEQEFKEFSFGFRPGRSAHDGLEYLWKQCMDNQVRWIVDVDIRSYFDTLDHAKLREIVSQRVRDGVVRRLIDKWLKAGVMEAGELSYREKGTPQGGVVSPILSNIYLHEVLDKWFAHEVKARLKGRAFLVRYADDFVMGFECEQDAQRVYAVLPTGVMEAGELSYNQAGFGRMEIQAVFPKALWQHCIDPLGIFLALKAHDKIIDQNPTDSLCSPLDRFAAVESYTLRIFPEAHQAEPEVGLEALPGNIQRHQRPTDFNREPSTDSGVE